MAGAGSGMLGGSCPGPIEPYLQQDFQFRRDIRNRADSFIVREQPEVEHADSRSHHWIYTQKADGVAGIHALSLGDCDALGGFKIVVDGVPIVELNKNVRVIESLRGVNNALDTSRGGRFYYSADWCHEIHSSMEAFGVLGRDF